MKVKQALKLLFGIICFMLVGCGGGGGGGSAPGSGSFTATGMVTLPTGFTLSLSQLQIATEDGQVPVKANGSFSVPLSSAGPHIVQLVDTKTNKIVLLGYADPASSGSPFAGGQGQVSATSTADALLFIGLEGGAFSTDDWTNFLTLIHGSSQETQVASVVTTSVVANPTAISDGDMPIENAVAAIQSTSTYTVPSCPL